MSLVNAVDTLEFDLEEYRQFLEMVRLNQTPVDNSQMNGLEMRDYLQKIREVLA